MLPVVSVLYREPKLLKFLCSREEAEAFFDVSVLYREPKLLKLEAAANELMKVCRFSALP